jgi:polyhydroxyalkanoate synthesis regulator protein
VAIKDVVIRKYANRKFYDEDQHRYLSIMEVADLSASGHRVMVVCDRTGRDLTLVTLSRALYERLNDRQTEEEFLSNGELPEPFSPMLLGKMIAKVPGVER